MYFKYVFQILVFEILPSTDYEYIQRHMIHVEV